MELLLDDKDKIKFGVGKKLNINGKNYYIKRCLDKFPSTEIVAEKLCNVLGIKCAHYEVVEIDGETFHLSELLGENGYFVTGLELSRVAKEEDADISEDSLYYIWEVLDTYFEKSGIPMLDMIKVYLFDIMFLNPDRYGQNWALVNDGEGPYVAIFDNELMFEVWSSVLSSKMTESDNLRSYTDKKNFDISFRNSLEIAPEGYLNILHELEYFLATSDDLYSELLEGMLEKVTPEVLEKILNEVDASDELKDNWMYIYKKHHKNMKALLETRGKNGKRIH